MNNRILIAGNGDEYVKWFSKPDSKFTVHSLTDTCLLDEFIQDHAVDLIVQVVDDNFFQDISQIEKLKQTDDYKDIPVIVIDKSPFPIPNNSKLAFQSGATDYIRNHVSEFELESRVENQFKFYRRLHEIISENSIAKETMDLMDRLVLFMDRADNSFVIFDADGKIEWVNDGFTRLYGYSLDEFKRHFGHTIFDVSKNSDIKNKVERCVKTKKSISYVAECKTRSGEFKWIQTTFTPIVSSSGKIERFIAIETDITKLKETEEALNQKNEYMMALTNHLKSANSLLEEQQNEINTQNKALVLERQKSDELLLNILPYEVARQLRSKGEAKPKDYKLASVLFLDFADFSYLTRNLETKVLVTVLDSYFKKFDDVVEKHFVEKIKTIGDAYMCAGGLPLSNRSNPFNVVLAALEMQFIVSGLIEETRAPSGHEWRCRIGVHSGPVIAGVVGRKKYIYDIWGDTVNIASRMQQESEIGRVNISGITYSYIKDYFECEYRGKIGVKHGDKTDMYFVKRLKVEFSADETGVIPNEEFNKMLNAL